MSIKQLITEMVQDTLSEMKQPYVVIDTADGDKVVAMASDEKGAKSIIATSELPPMSIKDKNILKIVKTRKKQSIGYPLSEEVELDGAVDHHNNLNDLIFDFQKKIMNYGRSTLDANIAKKLKVIDNDLDDLRGDLFKVRKGR